MGIYHLTGRRKRASRKGRTNPKKDKKPKASLYFCYMSEIELQGLLDRTNPLGNDEEAMDMVVIDNVRISKFDLRALKVGKNVPFELKEELRKFNSEYLRKDNVFPTKNGAPRMITQYKDQYTKTMPGRKPKPLLTIKANHHHGKPATRKVLEHFVRITPVVGKCDDPRCFSRLLGHSAQAGPRNHQGLCPDLISGNYSNYGCIDQQLYEAGSKHATTGNRRDQKASWQEIRHQT
jgi:hypothetical protein